ncbi:MAG TPA: sigma factor-like helix-turn-helix DNA-binding protein [Candidatus Saccharimonadales bacterium]|nr:sigma factor-like helix-turn-helix DNA-binding protein [Candidatus Saccharimonadales bacterium]
MTTPQIKPQSIKPFDYKGAVAAILKTLKRDRDRQIIAKRFGFGLAKSQTLEKIGRNFGITRERVRQIEKATLAKIASLDSPEINQANQLLASYLEQQGGVSLAHDVADQMGASSPAEESYIAFLATLAPGIMVIPEDDEVRSALAIAPQYSRQAVKQLIGELVRAITKVGRPVTLGAIQKDLDRPLPSHLVENLAKISKRLACLENQWGLISWPEVNPKSIRDKTYLVLTKHGQPLHFTQISHHIKNSSFQRRDVTVQAVHNELIKDPRFVLIGRGIYALAEWGYAAGTVADIIIDVLKASKAPLHKDEIIKRVLEKRQVKTTTIILNLQEKDHFVRVAKATYKLKDHKA